LKARDWTLLTIAAGKSPLEPVELQKALFLLSRNISKRTLGRDFYDFAPYDYGPFAKDIYDDARALQVANLVTISREPGSRFSIYVPTPEGKEAATKLREGLSNASVDYLDRVVAFVQSVSFTELVSAIYKAYPEMRKNSVFQG